jgi:hypothetical protein
MNGIRIANKAMGDSNGLAYDTTNIHTQVLLGQSPPHMDLLQFTNMTDWNDGLFHEEILFTMNHGLNYIPRVFSYYYVYNAPVDYSANDIGAYTQGAFYMSGGGPYYDQIWTYIDSSVMQVRHTTYDQRGGKPTDNPSSGYGIRMKYMISNLEKTIPITSYLNITNRFP